jgi:tyrosyl-DNA phosphodiesterase-1
MSVGGKYIGVPEMEKSGLGRLSKVLRDEGWLAPKGEKLSVEYQGSSLGAYNAKWLNDFYSACEGRDLPTIQRRQGSSVMPPVKIIFPSLATVDNSINGRPVSKPRWRVLTTGRRHHV